jgi:gliding motility-associated lipoprotein GldD
MKQTHKVFFISFKLLSFLVLFGCKDEIPVPKPPTYLKINFPSKSYQTYVDECSYEFDIPDYFKVEKVQNSCNRDISFDQLNGTLHLSFIQMDTTLKTYIDYSLNKLDEHKIKAFAITDSNFINNELGTYGTFFELKGNVASPFQFYLTDSTDIFVNGVIYFNSRPNYDSIKPVLDFIKPDLHKLMSSMKWNKSFSFE